MRLLGATFANLLNVHGNAVMLHPSFFTEHLVGTSYNNPKGNADTERVIRTLKEDLIWPREWFGFQQLRNALEKWMRDYNEDFPRSAIGYLTPCQYEERYNQKKQQQELSATLA